MHVRSVSVPPELGALTGLAAGGPAAGPAVGGSAGGAARVPQDSAFGAQAAALGATPPASAAGLQTRISNTGPGGGDVSSSSPVWMRSCVTPELCVLLNNMEEVVQQQVCFCVCGQGGEGGRGVWYASVGELVCVCMCVHACVCVCVFMCVLVYVYVCIMFVYRDHAENAAVRKRSHSDIPSSFHWCTSIHNTVP